MFFSTNGKAIKSLSMNDVFGAGYEASLVGQQDASPRAYYAVVPFVRRAVRLRCNAVAGVPVTLQRGSRDIGARPEFTGLMGRLQQLIWKTEFALCLSPYGAYWLRAQNAAGLNPTPEWLLPHACWPFITAERGLEYIRYVRPWGVPRAGQVDFLYPDDIVRFWLPSIDRANWPGHPPGLAALAASSALADRDLFASNYFRRGAIKGVLLSVPPATHPEERQRLKTWWDQIVAGVHNAWRSIVISADVKPIVIGEGVGDVANEGYTRQYRQDLAAAFEVPESMLLSNAANYATAREERISFYEETVFPALQLILDAINDQWIRDAYDAELVAHPEQTEARQDAQVQQAQAITDLVGKPVLSLNEGRAFLGMEPIEDTPEPSSDEQGDYQAMDADEEADDAAEESADQVAAPDKDEEEGGTPDDESDGEGDTEEEKGGADGETARAKKTLAPLRTGGATARRSERRTLISAHRAMRAATRDRHDMERRLLRDRLIAERTTAESAGQRLRLVRRQQMELITLDQRHAAERAMLRELQQSERGRLRERHAGARNAERGKAAT